MQEWLKNILNPSTESKIEGVKNQDFTLQAANIADKSSLQEINDLVASVAQGIVFREVPTLQETKLSGVESLEISRSGIVFQILGSRFGSRV